MNTKISELLSKFDQTFDPNPDRLRIILLGERDRIIQTTHHLHRLGFADVKDWSLPLPLPNSTDSFSLLTRSRRT